MNDLTITTYLDRHETYLQTRLTNHDLPSPRLQQAMEYTLFPGGKRIRPLLVYLVGELLHTPLECLDVIAAAIELTHSYSLVHDDLPAMDNDDLRRGKPSCHRAFDEGTAILVGDALQVFAIDILLTQLPALLKPEKVIAVTLALTKASGAEGMISGQSLDLYQTHPGEHYDKKSHEKTLRLIHELKTGQLMMACVNMAISASDNPDVQAIQALRNYAYLLGIAFQIQDDYLDCYASPDILGKGHASDKHNEKITFADCYSQQELNDLTIHYYQSALQELNYFGYRSEKLQRLTRDLQQRQ